MTDTWWAISSECPITMSPNNEGRDQTGREKRRRTRRKEEEEEEQRRGRTMTKDNWEKKEDKKKKSVQKPVPEPVEWVYRKRRTKKERMVEQNIRRTRKTKKEERGWGRRQSSTSSTKVRRNRRTKKGWGGWVEVGRETRERMVKQKEVK